MNVEFVNAYIERLVREVQELTKTRLLNEAQITLFEKVNRDLLARIEKLEEKSVKKSKKEQEKEKEVDTSEGF